MKKLMGVLAAFVVLFGLTACGTKYDFTCTGNVDDYDTTVNGVVKDGKVTKIIVEQKIVASSEEEAKQGVEMINGFGSMAPESGMTMTAKANGKNVTMTTTVDVAKAVAASDETAENSLGLDLSNVTKDAMVKVFEDEGLTCK